jgi:hypothetical protein
MWTEGNLPEKFKKQILTVARYMIFENMYQHSLNNGEIDGFVETHFLKTKIGQFTGVRFYAIIEFGVSRTEVYFMLTDCKKN